ncbi:hypothetical protein EIN_077940 [Entamoeba invadens IP1]|uniref:Uncharacterized protein n=1 Tax=Entamoeba invadens IP1 TaxID=370355 RepID=A0A0A1TWB0_ENTIV|nr:hypothetical protein EIN_077940 [Entamoeba invadens IP1]ELP83589.1 hypothetical protein EIN_077940 [Entamoeba invadens IP1]|eukprot:XP_004182935.1 hypothetical protein EIN_077940 [Entamoeba invadens IP1]
MVKLEKVYLMNVILFLDSLKTFQKFVLISKDCVTAFTMLRKNPNYSLETLSTELKYFTYTKHETLCSTYLIGLPYFQIASVLDITVTVSEYFTLVKQQEIVLKIRKLTLIQDISILPLMPNKKNIFDITLFPNIQHITFNILPYVNTYNDDTNVINFYNFRQLETSKVLTIHFYCYSPSRFEFDQSAANTGDVALRLLNLNSELFVKCKNTTFYFVTDTPVNIRKLPNDAENIIIASSVFTDIPGVINLYDCVKRPTHMAQIEQNFLKYYLMELIIKKINFPSFANFEKITTLTALTFFKADKDVKLILPETLRRLEVSIVRKYSIEANLKNVTFLKVNGILKSELGDGLEMLSTTNKVDWMKCTKLREINLENVECNGEIVLPESTTKLSIDEQQNKVVDVRNSKLKVLELKQTKFERVFAPKSLIKIYTDFEIEEVCGFHGELVVKYKNNTTCNTYTKNWCKIA